MTSIDERLLETKMTQIEQARNWSPRVISKFETLIRGSDEVSLHRLAAREAGALAAIRRGSTVGWPETPRRLPR